MARYQHIDTSCSRSSCVRTPVLAPTTVLTADAGYHSEANLKQLTEQHVEALVGDSDLRRRDERFATQDRHRTAPHPLRDLTGGRPEPRAFQPADFTYDADARTCVCPAGKTLHRSGRDVVTRGYVADHFRGAKGVCAPCPLRTQCLRTPETTPTRQVAFFRGRAAGTPETHTARMKRRLDTPEGRAPYGQRFATVEPVFGNRRANKRLDRFTLRGRAKVDGQWKLYCLVHNIDKLARHGYAA